MRVRLPVVILLVVVAFLAGSGLTYVVSRPADAPGGTHNTPRDGIASQPDDADPAEQSARNARDKHAADQPDADPAADTHKAANDPKRPDPADKAVDRKLDKAIDPKSDTDKPAPDAKDAPAASEPPAGPHMGVSELGNPVDFSISISGTVVDTLGNPVPGAAVSYDKVERAGTTTGASSGEKFATADASGNFSGTIKTKVGDKAAVIMALRAVAKGHARSSMVTVAVKSGDDKTGVRIALRGAGVVRGRVVTGADAPVPGATVSLESRDPDEGVVRDGSGHAAAFGGGHKAQTDANGEYTIEEVAEGEYNVALKAPGFKESRGPRTADVHLGATAQLDNFVVAPTTSLRARVIGEDGKPVWGYVSFEFTATDGAVLKKLTEMIGTDGSVVVNNPPVGACNVTATVRGFTPSAKAWLTFAQDTQTDMGTVTLTAQPDSQKSKLTMVSAR